MELLYFLVERFIPEKWKSGNRTFDKTMLLILVFCCSVFYLSILALFSTLSGPDDIGYMEGSLKNCRIRKPVAVFEGHGDDSLHVEFQIDSSELLFTHTIKEMDDTGIFRDGNRVAIAFHKSGAKLGGNHFVYEIKAEGKTIGSIQNTVDTHRNVRAVFFTFGVAAGLGVYYSARARRRYLEGRGKPRG